MDTRRVKITCPLCGNVGFYMLKAVEGFPQVQLVLCHLETGGCDMPFAVEVRMSVQIEVSTCRLNLPSVMPIDALQEIDSTVNPDGDIAF